VKWKFRLPVEYQNYLTRRVKLDKSISP